MRRGGVFALVTYMLYTLLYGGLTLMFYYEMDKLKDEKLFGALMLIFVVLIGLCVSLAIGGLVAAILKIVHMATGKLVFGISCILVDAFVLIYMVASVFPAIYSDIITQGVTETSIIVIIGIIVTFFLSVGALISNIKSLKN